jgi:hypothetical protein
MNIQVAMHPVQIPRIEYGVGAGVAEEYGGVLDGRSGYFILKGNYLYKDG